MRRRHHVEVEAVVVVTRDGVAEEAFTFMGVPMHRVDAEAHAQRLRDARVPAAGHVLVQE